MRNLVDKGIDWVGAVPENWHFQKGKYLFQQRSERGNTIELQLLSPTQKFGCIPQSLYEELSGAHAVKLNEKTDLNLLKTIHRGDFCISLRSFQGGFEYSDYEGVVSPAYQVFYPIHDNVYRGYYKYMFKDGAFIDKMNSFTLSLRDGKKIAFADFGNTLLPLPSLEEQQAIADYLDKKTSEIDSAIKEAQELIDKYKEYKQSIITEAVTKGLNPNVAMKDSGVEWIGEIPEHWKVGRFVSLNWIRARLGWKGLKAEEYTETGFPLLSAFNIVNYQLDWSNINYINQERYDESPEIKLSIGDILLVKDGAGIGKCARIDKLPYGHSTVNGSIAVITPQKGLYYKYLCYYLQSKPFWSIINLLLVGMGVPHLTQANMKKIKLPLPSIEEQKTISCYLDEKCSQIDTIITEKESLISRLQEYRKSIIFEYVTGKKEVPNG